ncbi:MAG: cadherin-like domain-containing protein [Planctomycetota bacterium]
MSSSISLRGASPLRGIAVLSLAFLSSCGGGGGGGGGGAAAAPNGTPVAVADAAMTAEDTAVVIAVLANDSDPDGDALTVVLSAALLGTAVLQGDGTVMYTPNPNTNGQQFFAYAVRDSAGNASAAATVTVNVTALNDFPMASDDTAATLQSTAVTVDVLANDTDADAEPLTITQVTQPAGGNSSIVGGAIVYTPAAAFAGADSFDYTIRDAAGATSTATVTLTVLSFNLDFRVLDQVASYSPATGATSFNSGLFVALAAPTPTPPAIDGIDMKLDYDSRYIVVLSVSEGPALASLNGGSGPEFFGVMNDGSSVSIEIVISASGEQLIIDTPQQVATLMCFSNLGGLRGDFDGVVAALTWDPSGGANSVAIGGQTITPSLVDAAIQYVAGPLAPDFYFFAPAQTVLYNLASGQGSFTEVLYVLEELGPGAPPGAMSGVSVGLSYDTNFLDAVAVNPGAALLALGGGAGADYFQASLLPNGITVGTIFSFTSAFSLIAPDPEPMVEVAFELVPNDLIGNPDGVNAPMNWIDTLGAPPVPNLVVTAGATSEFPITAAGLIFLRPQP